MPERQIPSKEVIVDAERERVARRYPTARAMVGDIAGFPLDGFSGLPADERRRFLSAARISASSSISLARRLWSAPAVARELSQARDVIVNVYDHPEVQTSAKRLKKGINHEPYEYHTEMSRDKIAYLLTLAALTGNSVFRLAAIEEMDKAIDGAKEESVRTLLEFERQRLLHSESPSQDSFAALTDAFWAGASAAHEAGNRERVATIAARYIIDAEEFGESPYNEMVNAHRIFDIAAADDLELNYILHNERVKKGNEPEQHEIWRRSTPAGVDYSHLALPQSA